MAGLSLFLVPIAAALTALVAAPTPQWTAGHDRTRDVVMLASRFRVRERARRFAGGGLERVCSTASALRGEGAAGSRTEESSGVKSSLATPWTPAAIPERSAATDTVSDTDTVRRRPVTPEKKRTTSTAESTPAVLSPEICLMPGVPICRVEAAPGNARRIFTGIDIVAPCEDVCEVVWRVMNDYERLSDAVPNLVENTVEERYEDSGGARLRQVGAARLAPMVVFRATTTLEVRPYATGLPAEMTATHLDDSADSAAVRAFDRALPLEWDIFPRPYCISKLPHRDITMQGVKGKGDFRFYQGVWRMQALPNCAPTGCSAMRLTYSVELSPKAWVPVALLEGKIAETLASNLESVRDHVQKPGVLKYYCDEVGRGAAGRR